MIDIDFNKVIHGEQILFNKCKGKTIKDTYIGNEILCIIFDDNSFVYLEEYDDYEDDFRDLNTGICALDRTYIFDKRVEKLVDIFDKAISFIEEHTDLPKDEIINRINSKIIESLAAEILLKIPEWQPLPGGPMLWPILQYYFAVL